VGIFITRVLRLREDGDYDQALEQITQAYGRLAGLPASLVHGISEEDLLALLSTRGRLAADRCVALAELLREEGLVFEEQGRDDEALPRYLKALRLYLEALHEQESLRAADIPGLDDVVKRVSWLPLAAPTRELLLPYLEATGQFDQLENALVAWVEIDGEGEAAARAREVYKRLLTKPDAELIVGGLTRGEVDEALAALEMESAEEISGVQPGKEPRAPVKG
jgi:hypothetical protein